VLTRPAGAADKAARRLRALGADVIEMPLIRIVSPPDAPALAAAAQRVCDYDWIAFTSVNAVEAFAPLCHEPLAIAARIAAVGPATGRAVHAAFGRAPDLVPESFTAVDLGAELASVMTSSARVLVVQAHDARPELLLALTRAGRAADAVAAYATVEAPPDDVGAVLQGAHIVVLASGSAARSLAKGLGQSRVGILAAKIVACIGPVTAEEARRAGIPVTIVSREFSMDGVIDAVVECVVAR
jgi:uroporphyrinogen-III synthase